MTPDEYTRGLEERVAALVEENELLESRDAALQAQIGTRANESAELREQIEKLEDEAEGYKLQIAKAALDSAELRYALTLMSSVYEGPRDVQDVARAALARRSRS